MDDKYIEECVRQLGLVAVSPPMGEDVLRAIAKRCGASELEAVHKVIEQHQKLARCIVEALIEHSDQKTRFIVEALKGGEN